jgi:hypothetical protein
LDASVTKPLFYETVVPINTKVHGKLRLGRPDQPLAYAREANIIPALADEFESAMSELPIVFIPGTTQPSAVFVTSSQPGTNAFISDEGLWNGAYVPAYLRRYPFIIGDVENGESVLCVDETYAGLSETEGAPLFDKKGKADTALNEALAISQSYRDIGAKTEAFCAKLLELNLLQSATLDTTNAEGGKSTMHGILVVNEAALGDLNAEQVFELHQAGYLKAIYNHLASLRSVSNLQPSVPADTDKVNT